MHLGPYNWVGFLLLAASAFVLALAYSHRAAWPVQLQRLLLAGLFLRVVGSTARYEVLVRFYNWAGDASEYFRAGVLYASQFLSFNFEVLFDPSLWWQHKWWGTQFVRFVSGFVITLVGPTMRGEFFVFSLFSFIGLGLIGVAFRRANPGVPITHYLRWAWLWPSLCFWPASVGKEAVIMLAIGLAVLGHVGDGRRPRWPLFLLGLAFAFAIRPHIAAALVISAGAAHWLVGRSQRRKGVWILQGIVVGLVAVAVVTLALNRLGIEEVDLEGVHEFMEHRSTLTATGTSNIGARTGGLSAVPMAFVNILMRPFIWEAHHALALLSSLEMVAFWILLWRRRKAVAQALRGATHERLLSFSLVFAVIYILMIGLVFNNLGIIARQRVIMLPFLFVLLESRSPRSVRAARASAAGPSRLPDARRRPPAAAARPGVPAARWNP